jgi:TonB-dependent receptor
MRKPTKGALNSRHTMLAVAANLLVMGAPAWAQTAPAAAASTPDADAKAQTLETVVVSGIRASAQSSVAVKKNAMEVVDAITAEDIGKLPDTNVAETITRIPGVQGYRYGGEGASPVGVGSGLTIRGLANQTASQVDGRAYFTAGAREFNVEGAIPAMVAGIDVYKNPSAEHIEGGIGGLVNIRTRKPSDFRKPTYAFSANARYNDLAGKTDPEVSGLAANSWNLGGGERVGALIAGVFQKSTGRSDNNPANGGVNLKRVVRADSAEYATLAAANTTNDPSKAMAAYVGRTDVSLLTGGTMPTTSGQDANLISAPGLTTNVFQETIMRTRKGLNLAADYRKSDTLRFYAEANYNYYLYHQNYRGLNSVDGANVQNLQTTAFNLTEGLANRNLNGGSDDVLLSKRFLSGNFLNSSANTTGGDETHPYTTWVAATGVEWKPTSALSLKGDFSYIKADQSVDNRSVQLVSAPGQFWTTTRVADGEPHQLTFSGPSFADPATWVFNNYGNGNRQTWDDKGYAAALSGEYELDGGFFTAIKFGARAANQQDLNKSFSYGGKNLTTDGAALAANRSNAIYASAMPGVLQFAPSNFMDGKAGYAGGYLVYSPDALLGDQVRTAFPNAGIPADNALPENAVNRRKFNEHTYAAYAVGEFSAFDDKLRGGVGLRLVRTQTEIAARQQFGSTIVDVVKNSAYTNALPSFNVTGELSKDFLVRFGYGRGLTRPAIGDLSPGASVNTNNGTVGIGNPDLKPQVADSFDLSLERYFTPTNYVALGLFDKEIKDAPNAILSCQTLSQVYTGTLSNGCSNGQFAVTQAVNSLKGYARGMELSGQYFFDAKAGWLQNFGVSASYTYVSTSIPINFGTAAAPRIVAAQQPFVSKNNFTLAGMYEDSSMSARLTYTWRSDQVLFGVSTNPIDGRYIGAYGILDAAFNYNLSKNLTLSANALNLTNRGLNRYVGEPGTYATGLERQHYDNGRAFTLGLRYKFD